MKQILLLLCIAVFITSCGAQKKALEAQNQLLQEQVTMQQQQIEKQEQQQRIQAQSQRPARALRDTEPCVALSLDEKGNMRSFGTARSTIEKVAKNEALRDARNQLAQRMEVAVKGASEDHDKNANQDNVVSAQLIGEAVIGQFVNQTIQNTKPIKWSVYDLSDGTVEVYVCIEMIVNKEEFEEELNDRLSRDKIIENEVDRERFIKKTSEGLQKYVEEQKNR